MFTISAKTVDSILDKAKLSLPKLPVCLNCNSFCPLSIDYNIPAKVTFDCKCGNKSTLLISDYVHQMNNNYKPINNLCKSHRFQNFEFFCKTCQLHLCKDCDWNLSHKDHEIVNLSERKNKVELFAKINDLYFSRKVNDIKSLVKKLVSDLELSIQQISEAYLQFEKNNFKTWEFVRSFNQKQDKYINYYWQENVINDCHYNDVEFKAYYHDENNPLSKSNIDALVAFLKSYHVMNNPVKFNKIDQIKQIEMNQINNLIVLKDGRLATSSNDKTIKIYNRNTFECELFLKCHTSAVEYISQRNNEDLLSCSIDQSIKIWKKTDNIFILEKSIDNAHTNMIHKVIEIDNKRIASCSDDMTVKLWEGNKPYELITTLDHGSAVFTILNIKQTDILLSGSYYEVKEWDLNTYKCMKSFLASCINPNSMMENNGKIVVAGRIIIVLNYSFSFPLIKELNTNIYLSSVIELRDGSFLCGGDKGVLYHFEFTRTYPNIIYTNHKRTINTLINIDSKTFISCSFDSIIVWNY